jgi:hypothetical protein
LDRFVADARQTGLSWIEIGARLGVTKQAAGNASPTRRPPWSSIRTCGCHPGCEAAWTGRTLSLRPMALLRWAPTISSPGLLADGVAAAILDSLGVTTQAIQNSAAELSDATESVDADRAPMLSAEAVCAVEAAAGHARTTAADPEQVEVGTEHLLLVLVMDPGSRARRVLLDLGTDIVDIKKELACHVTLNPRVLGGGASVGAGTLQPARSTAPVNRSSAAGPRPWWCSNLRDVHSPSRPGAGPAGRIDTRR